MTRSGPASPVPDRPPPEGLLAERGDVTRSTRAKIWTRVRIQGLVAATALSLTGSAWGQNLIENGGFDEDLTGGALLAAGDSSATWNALDAEDSATSGVLPAATRILTPAPEK